MEIEQLGDAPSPHGELLGECRLKSKHYILDTVENYYRSPRPTFQASSRLSLSLSGEAISG